MSAAHLIGVAAASVALAAVIVGMIKRRNAPEGRKRAIRAMEKGKQ